MYTLIVNGMIFCLKALVVDVVNVVVKCLSSILVFFFLVVVRKVRCYFLFAVFSVGKSIYLRTNLVSLLLVQLTGIIYSFLYSQSLPPILQ